MAQEMKLNEEQQKLVDFMNNPTCIAEMNAAKTPAEGVQVFKNHGIDMDEERLKTFLEIGINMKDKGGELSEDDLKKVTGGLSYGYYYDYSFTWSYTYTWSYTSYTSWYSSSYGWYSTWYY